MGTNAYISINNRNINIKQILLHNWNKASIYDISRNYEFYTPVILLMWNQLSVQPYDRTVSQANKITNKY